MAKLQEIIDSLTARDARNQEQIEALLAGQKRRDKKLSYYENPNMPPSSNSLAYIKSRRQRAEQRKDNPDAQGKKPGAKKGHEGKSRNHTPTRREYHKFESKSVGGKDVPILPECSCGGHTMQGLVEILDIVDITFEASETRHSTETA